MADILNVKEIENKVLKSSAHKQVNKVSYHINRKDNKTINTAMFKDIYDTFEKKYGADNLLVRAVNNTGMMTLKTFGQDELNFIDFDDYYNNKVKSTANFKYFDSIEITILKKTK